MFETLSYASSMVVFFIVMCFIALLAIQNEPAGITRSQGQERSAQDRVILAPSSKSDDESSPVTPRSTHGHADETKGKC